MDPYEELMEEQVRKGYRGYWAANSIPGKQADSEIDAWLALRDKRIRTEYEASRNPDPIHIDNIDSIDADVWFASYTAKIKAEAWDEGVRAAFHESIEGSAGVHWTPSDMTNHYRSEQENRCRFTWAAGLGWCMCDLEAGHGDRHIHTWPQGESWVLVGAEDHVRHDDSEV